MTEETSASQLHDRVTRGGALTEAERATLEAWYEQQDLEEAAQLAASSSAAPPLDNLRTKVSDALTQINEVIQRIREQSEENEALRQEVTALSRRLTQAAPLRAA